jgi:hypothetical protein
MCELSRVRSTWPSGAGRTPFLPSLTAGTCTSLNPLAPVQIRPCRVWPLTLYLPNPGKGTDEPKSAIIWRARPPASASCWGWPASASFSWGAHVLRHHGGGRRHGRLSPTLSPTLSPARLWSLSPASSRALRASPSSSVASCRPSSGASALPLRLSLSPPGKARLLSPRSSSTVQAHIALSTRGGVARSRPSRGLG